MENKIAKTILVIFIVISVSGCVNENRSGSGVVIEDFGPDIDRVFSGESVSFYVKLRNTGDVRAEDVAVELLGLENWQCSGVCEADMLLPRNVNTGSRGEVKTCKFSCRAPKVPEGLGVDYQPVARAEYRYTSHSVKSITFVSKDEIKRLVDSGRALPSETLSTTKGPVRIEINIKGPVRYWGDNEIAFPVEIIVKNVGDGKVKYGNELNKLLLKIDSGDIGLSKCKYEQEIELWNGREYRTVCRFIAGVGETGLMQKTVRVYAEYNYVTERSGHITVMWKR